MRFGPSVYHLFIDNSLWKALKVAFEVLVQTLRLEQSEAKVEVEKFSTCLNLSDEVRLKPIDTVSTFYFI